MSTSYSFYIGYTEEGSKVIHPYGPFNNFNKLYPIFTKSRSFISDIYTEFSKTDIDELDDKLKEEFTYHSDLTDKIENNLYYLDIDNLPSSDFMKDGYFPVEDIASYFEERESEYDEFYYSDKISSESYSIQLEVAVKSDNKETIERLKGYTYFRYPDFNCIEYDSFLIKKSFSEWDIKYELENKNGLKIDKILILMDIS